MRLIRRRDGTYDVNMTEDETNRFLVSHITRDYSLVGDFDSALCAALEIHFADRQANGAKVRNSASVRRCAHTRAS